MLADDDRPMFSGQEIIGLNEMAAVIEQERNKSSRLNDQDLEESEGENDTLAQALGILNDNDLHHQNS